MADKDNNFFKTGIAGFDALVGAGIPKGSNILVEGGPGSGKTIFCLQILYNACKRGEKGLYMSFEEPVHRLESHMRGFGWDYKKLEEKGLLKIQRYNALDIARSVEALLSEAKKELLIEVNPILIPKDFVPDVVVMDSLSAIAAAFSGEENRFRIYMEQLFRYLEKNNITSFLIREVSNIMDKFGRRSSAIEVLKMRGADITKKIVKMKIINGKGIEVLPNSIIGEAMKEGFSFT